MWLAEVYGAAGGTTAAVGTNASTASAGLLANNYRFHNYNLTITAPDGTTSTQIFNVISDTTSSQYTVFTPTRLAPTLSSLLSQGKSTERMVTVTKNRH